MPLLPPTAALETHTILKQCILARAALAELKQAANLGGRHAASRYLKRLVELGVLKETKRVDEDPALVVSFAERQRLVGKADWDALENRYT